MAGLLDNPNDAALMQMGFGLLQAGGPSRMPVSLGQAIGGAGQGAMDAYRQTEQLNQQKQMREMQMQQQRMEQERAKQQQEFLSQAAAQITDPQEKAFAQAFPKEWAHAKFAAQKQMEPKLVTVMTPNGPMQRWMRPGEANGVDIGAPVDAQKAQTELEKLIAARDRLPMNDPNRIAFNNAISKASTHAPAPSANVNFKQETEEAKAVGKAFGETYGDLMKADMMASSKIAKYDQLGQLLSGVDTGRLTPIGTDIAGFAKSMGVNIDPNLGNKQAAEAISNDLALQLRNPSGGAGMPGALSDKDREFLTKMTPGIGKDPQANKVLIDTAKKLAQREKDVAKIARQYRAKKGTLDEGFYEELATFSERNPLFDSGSSGWSATVVK